MKTAKLLLISILSVFAPIQSVLLTAFVLAIADLVTGVMASLKRKEPITSAGFRRTTTKIFIYEMGIMMAFLAQTYLTGESMPVEKIVAGFIGLTELTSIIENLNSISGGSLLTALIAKLNGNVKSPSNDN